MGFPPDQLIFRTNGETGDFRVGRAPNHPPLPPPFVGPTNTRLWVKHGYPKMEPWKMEPMANTGGPIPGGLVLTHTHPGRLAQDANQSIYPAKPATNSEASEVPVRGPDELCNDKSWRISGRQGGPSRGFGFGPPKITDWFAFVFPPFPPPPFPPKKNINYFASSNPHPPHSRAYDREHGCVNSSMVFEWLGAYDCSTSFALRALSTCLCVKPHLSASRSRELKHRLR